MQALEDDVRVEGVGAVPTTLQAEMMPSGEKKSYFVIVKKRPLVFWSLAVRGQNVASDKWGV